MMLVWVLEFIAYAALVAGATWLSRRHTMAVVGLTLGVCLLVSEAGFFGTSFASRVALESIQAIVIIRAAQVTFVAEPDWPSALVVSLSIMDLALCAGFGLGVFQPAERVQIGGLDLALYGNATNFIYALQCLAVAAPGAIDAYLGRGSDSPADRAVGHPDAALDALRAQIEKL